MTSEPKRGDVFLWRGKGAIAWAIQKLTGSKWSHAGIVLDGETIFDADVGGCKARSIAPYLENRERMKLFRPFRTSDDIEAFIAYARSRYSGHGYDFVFFWRLFVAIVHRKRWRNFHDDKNRAVCFEIVARSLHAKAGIRCAPDGVDVDAATGRDIELALAPRYAV